MSTDANRKTVQTLWDALTAMDWEKLKSCLADDVHYEDVPTEDPGARGPENVVKRLAIAFDHLSEHTHTIHHMVCEGDVVFLDHTEGWTFKTGEKAAHTFATMHEMKDGKVAKWSDYWDVSGFVGQFPQWFLEEMAKSSQADFSD
jgi:ketosteroid isomerase-like protein